MVGHLGSNIRSPGACLMAYGAVRDKSNPLPRYFADGARLAKSNALSDYLASGGQARPPLGKSNSLSACSAGGGKDGRACAELICHPVCDILRCADVSSGTRLGASPLKKVTTGSKSTIKRI